MIYYDDKLVFIDSTIPKEARAWRNDKEVHQWCRQHTLISKSDQLAWKNKIATDPTIKMFGVYHPTYEGQCVPVGVCGFTSINHRLQSAEFSLYIAPEFQKKGYGIDALTTLLRHGFEDWNFHRIWGEVLDGNPALNTFKDLGFKEDGFLRDTYFKNGVFIGSHMISILKGEF